MAKFRVSTLSTLTIAVAVSLTAMVACTEDSSDLLKSGGSSGASSGGSSGSSGVNGEGGTNPGGPGPEEVLFRALEGDFEKKCGGRCHTEGTYSPTPPKFLAKPDAYKSIKAAPGIVVADYFSSAVLTKGGHAGPAVGDDVEFEAKVIEWLKTEAAVIASAKKPTTAEHQVVSGYNELDLTPAAQGGITGVKLKFNASLIGGLLSLDGMKLVAPAGPDVHILKPRFVRVLAKADENGIKEIPDPADSFSTTDQTVPNGAETTLAPGSVILSGTGWTPYDLATDKIRIEIEKLAPGKVQVIEKPDTCVNVAGFTANVLPSLRGGGGITPNCANCHGGGLAGLNLNSADNALICNQVIAKLNKANLAQSIIVTKVTGAAHNGGQVNNAGTWTALFTNNRAVFFAP